MTVLVLGVLAGLLVVAAPSPASAHAKGTNGCSTSGIVGVNVDRGSGWDFHDECDWHDLCYIYHWYGHSEAARRVCDDIWHDKMVSEARAQWPWWSPNRWAAESIANTYYRIVRLGGQQPFWDAWFWGWRNGMH